MLCFDDQSMFNKLNMNSIVSLQINRCTNFTNTSNCETDIKVSTKFINDLMLKIQYVNQDYDFVTMNSLPKSKDVLSEPTFL